MVLYDLTGLFWFLIGVIAGLGIKICYDAFKDVMEVRQEYLDSLSDSDYRKYTTFLKKLNWGVSSNRKVKK